MPRVMKSGGNKGRFFSPNIDYVLVYAKNIIKTEDFKGKMDEDSVNKLYNKLQESGQRKGEKYRPFGLYQSSLDSRPNQRYFIECPDGTFAIPPGKAMPKKIVDGGKVLPESNDGCWRWSQERYLDEKKKDNIVFIKSPNGILIDGDGNPSKWNVYTKIWLSDRQKTGQTPINFITKYENRHSAKELKELGIDFDFSKPVKLIKYLSSISNTKENDIIFDFFAGSSTTAHAVMQLNAEDGGKRKFIMVQLPEACGEKSEAFKSGYKTIAEISKERIRRAGKKIKEENATTAGNLDIGFRVLKVDSSNMADVYYTPDAVKQNLLPLLTDNIKGDRTAEDLLFQVMLDWGADLALPITKESIAGREVFFVDGNDLAACFEKDGKITGDFCKELARRKPQRVVFRDSGFKDDSVKINVEQIFKLISPTTDVKTI